MSRGPSYNLHATAVNQGDETIEFIEAVHLPITSQGKLYALVCIWRLMGRGHASTDNVHGMASLSLLQSFSMSVKEMYL